MPYWINDTLAAQPAVLWMFVGVGVPWALAVLPRKDWRDRALVACAALAFAPMLTTAWMFLLGTLGAVQNTMLLRFDTVFAGTVVLAAGGLLLAWGNARRGLGDSQPRDKTPFAIDEKLLIALIVAALVLRWFTTSYWTFDAYDPLWVFGYEGRLFTLVGNIPQKIGYYPQFLPLQYTYAQLAFGAINDHAARAVLPFLNVGSVLAVYALGSRLFTRRVGIIAAALWTLYPHVGEWMHIGDLEIAQTFLLTATAAFFFMAWMGQEPRRRYALIGGLIYGAALWTKPTAAAFVWGFLLLLALEFIRLRGKWRAMLPRIEVTVITGLAAVPLGGVWYLRNLLLGHPPLVLPDPFWLTQAQRSGVEFGWLLLALGALLAYLYFRKTADGSSGSRWRGGWGANAGRLLIGIALVAAGVTPSILSPHRMGFLEWAALAAGTGVLFLALKATLLSPTLFDIDMDGPVPTSAAKSGWMLALAAPYFVTWFYSYSYHYRLSFPIVPLMLMPTAVILAVWFAPGGMVVRRRLVYLGTVALISLPGVAITLHSYSGGWDWLWTDKYPDDDAKYFAENPALMFVVHGLQDYIKTHDTPPVVVAPGAQLLPFFFPLVDIRNSDTPTHLDDLAGATHYIYSKHAGWAYDAANIPPLTNQIVGALGRDDVLHFVTGHDDGNFFYNLYEVTQDNRFKTPQEVGITHILKENVTFGGFVRYAGDNLSFNVLSRGNRVSLQIAWQVLAPPPEDYMIYVQLRDENGKVWASWDGPIARNTFGYYSSLVWQPGELILDTRYLSLPADNPPPPGNHYRVYVGLYNLQTGVRVPMTIDGKPAGDGLVMPAQFTIR